MTIGRPESRLRHSVGPARRARQTKVICGPRGVCANCLDSFVASELPIPFSQGVEHSGTGITFGDIICEGYARTVLLEFLKCHEIVFLLLSIGDTDGVDLYRRCLIAEVSWELVFSAVQSFYAYLQ